MYYVGLDVHKNQSTFCVLNQESRKVMVRTVHGNSDAVVTALQKLKQPFSICFEASTGYGYLYEKHLPIARSVQLAHPKH